MKPLPGSRIAGWARKRSGLQGRSGSGPIRCEPDQQERTSDAEPGGGPVRVEPDCAGLGCCGAAEASQWVVGDDDAEQPAQRDCLARREGPYVFAGTTE